MPAMDGSLVLRDVGHVADDIRCAATRWPGPLDDVGPGRLHQDGQAPQERSRLVTQDVRERELLAQCDEAGQSEVMLRDGCACHGPRLDVGAGTDPRPLAGTDACSNLISGVVPRKVDAGQWGRVLLDG